MKVTLFDRIFNRRISEQGYTCYGRSFISRQDVDYLIEVSEAYGGADNFHETRLRAVLVGIDAGCTTIIALARYLKVSKQALFLRVQKSWRRVRSRAYCAVRAAEVERGFIPIADFYRLHNDPLAKGKMEDFLAALALRA